MLICVKLYQNKQAESASTTSRLMNLTRNSTVLSAKLFSALMSDSISRDKDYRKNEDTVSCDTLLRRNNGRRILRRNDFIGL